MVFYILDNGLLALFPSPKTPIYWNIEDCKFYLVGLSSYSSTLSNYFYLAVMPFSIIQFISFMVNSILRPFLPVMFCFYDRLPPIKGTCNKNIMYNPHSILHYSITS
jgi:hypothetical protein